MLDTIFAPRSVALIGASSTPGKLGFDILKNLINSAFVGNIYPVNPKGGKILNIPVFANVQDLPEVPELALIAVPAPVVGAVFEECAQKGIKNAVVISAGFQEIGAEGKKREAELRQKAKEHDIALIGPNCLGILSPKSGLNASFAEELPPTGNIALISQSGAMAVAVMDWAFSEYIGFSKVVSLGNRAGVSENDLLEYLENDSETAVIMLYLESFADGRNFRRIAERIAQKKPIILFKSGISPAGQKAVSSHTGALAGYDIAVDAALRQSGVLRARTIEDFFDYARLFSLQPLPSGDTVAVVTNAGGPGVIATDAVAVSQFLEMATFNTETNALLQQNLPPTANIHNPVDVIGDALADRYQNALSAVLSDKNISSALIILTPQIMTEKEKTVRVISQLQEAYPEKTICTAFMGGKNIAYAVEKLSESGIPNFLSPERAIYGLEKMVWLQQWREKTKQDSRKDKPHLVQKTEHSPHTAKQMPIEKAQALLVHYGIPVFDLNVAQNAEQAVEFAEKIGYPVVLKIASDQILHKTDVGGVRLALKDSAEVQNAYVQIMTNVEKNIPNSTISGVLVQKMYHFGREVIIGAKRDPDFGPLIMFGLGGVYVEVLKDVSFRVAPFSRQQALEMIHEIKAITLLKGVRGEAPADIEQLADTLLKISDLVLEHSEITELDINPLLVMSAGKGVVAADVRILT